MSDDVKDVLNVKELIPNKITIGDAPLTQNDNTISFRDGTSATWEMSSVSGGLFLKTSSGARRAVKIEGSGSGTSFSFADAGGHIIATTAAQKIAFHGETPIAQQTGVAVTAAGIHAALVNLGLITA